MNAYFFVHIDNDSSRNDLLAYLKDFNHLEIVKTSSNLIVIKMEYIQKDTVFHSFPMLENDLSASLTVLSAHENGELERYVIEKLSSKRKGKLFSMVEACLLLLKDDDAFLEEMLRLELGSIEHSLALTGKTFIESSFDFGTTAQMLNIHRNTLTYRLNVIKNIYSLDLRFFQDAAYFLLLLRISGICA